MLRLLLDALMVRRPLLEPNLSVGGLTFLGISLFVFLMANVVDGQAGCGRRGRLAAGGRSGRPQGARPMSSTACERTAPGFPLMFVLPQISTQSVLGEQGTAGNAGENRCRYAGQLRPSWSIS